MSSLYVKSSRGLGFIDLSNTVIPKKIWSSSEVFKINGTNRLITVWETSDLSGDYTLDFMYQGRVNLNGTMTNLWLYSHLVGDSLWAWDILGYQWGRIYGMEDSALGDEYFLPRVIKLAIPKNGVRTFKFLTSQSGNGFAFSVILGKRDSNSNVIGVYVAREDNNSNNPVNFEILKNVNIYKSENVDLAPGFYGVNYISNVSKGVSQNTEEALFNYYGTFLSSGQTVQLWQRDQNDQFKGMGSFKDDVAASGQANQRAVVPRLPGSSVCFTVRLKQGSKVCLLWMGSENNPWNRGAGNLGRGPQDPLPSFDTSNVYLYFHSSDNTPVEIDVWYRDNDWKVKNEFSSGHGLGIKNNEGVVIYDSGNTDPLQIMYQDTTSRSHTTTSSLIPIYYGENNFTNQHPSMLLTYSQAVCFYNRAIQKSGGLSFSALLIHEFSVDSLGRVVNEPRMLFGNRNGNSSSRYPVPLPVLTAR